MYKYLLLSILLSTSALNAMEVVAAEKLNQAIREDSPEKITGVMTYIASVPTMVKSIVKDSTSAIKNSLSNLIEKGFGNKSPLMWATLLKKPEAVKTMIESGSSFEQYDKDGNKIAMDFLSFPVKMSSSKVALVIAQSDADIKPYVNDYVRMAIDHSINRPEEREYAHNIIKTIISKYAFDINEAWDMGPNFLGQIHNASCCPITFKFLIAHGANPNHLINPNLTPLMQAIIHCNDEVPANVDHVRDLINVGSDVNFKAGENTPLKVAIAKGKYKLVELLLDNGANF